MLRFVPRYLRPRREKIFGEAPSHPLDGNAKARVWASAAAYNNANRKPGQHQGPLTWATLRVLRALLWRFHGADGGGRCFPSYERIAAIAKCARSSVAIAIRELEDAGILSWCNRIARIRRQEHDLFGQLVNVWQVIRTSNGYTFVDPLDREPGRKGYKFENRTGPTEPISKEQGRGGFRRRVMQKADLQEEHGSGGGALLSHAERAALVARLDTSPTKADWQLWQRDLDARIDTLQPSRCAH
jgi:hypothetical protein